MLSMSHSILIVAIVTVQIYAQSIFYGDNFVCDASSIDTTCEYGDNIICDSLSDCTLQCNDGCNGVIVNARTAKSLSITNCIDCDNMIIYCPHEDSHITDNSCTLEISNDVNNIDIYAQQSFNDFSVIQSYSELSMDYYVLSSTMHCGDLFMIEFQCTLDVDGNSCNSNIAQCVYYRIATASPTLGPTETMSPTTLPTISPTLQSSTDSYSSDESDDHEYVAMEDSDETVTLFSNTDEHNHNAHYVMLIIGLCIIWGSFFCCFIIMYYHREKKQELTKVVSIISRPKSPSYHPSKSEAIAKTPTKSSAKSFAKSSVKSSMKSPAKTPKPSEFSVESTMQKSKAFLPVPEPSMNSRTLITVHKVDDSKEIKELQDRRSIQSKALMVEVIPSFSPGATPRYQISPRMNFHSPRFNSPRFNSPRLSPRPYFYDAQMQGITPAASMCHVISPRGRPRLVLGDEVVYSNPISNGTTAEAVEIRLPCYEEHKQEMESALVLETPRFYEHDHHHDDMDDVDAKHDIRDDEGSIDSKYASRQYQEIMKGNNDNVEDKEEEEEDEEEEDEQTEGDEYPPPPPPSLVNAKNNTKQNENANKTYAQVMSPAIMSPSRHYRVKYSLGIQQDIKNCMSVPGFVGEKRFAFDDKTESTLKARSASPNALLKPPNTVSHGSPSSGYYSYRKYYAHAHAHVAPNPPVSSVTYCADNYYYQNPVTPLPQPLASPSTYLSFPDSRPRIYSDPTYPANNLCN